jgi:hypothetical protein
MNTKRKLAFAVFMVLGVAVALSAGNDKEPQKDINQTGLDNKKPTDAQLAFRQAYFLGASDAQLTIKDIAMSRSVKDDSKEILKGLVGVQVVVEKMNPDAEKYGLSSQILQTDTELRLRQHDVKIIMKEEIANELRNHNIRDLQNYKVMSELMESGEYDKALDKMKEPYKSLYISQLNEKSDKIFTEKVKQFLSYQEKSTEVAMLYINANVLVLEKQGGAFLDLNVEVLRNCSLTQTSGYIGPLPVWRRSVLLSRSLGTLKDARSEVGDLVDQFINDYLTANPKTKNSE